MKPKNESNYYTFITAWTMSNFDKRDTFGIADLKRLFFCWYKHKPTIKKLQEDFNRSILYLKFNNQ